MARRVIRSSRIPGGEKVVEKSLPSVQVGITPVPIMTLPETPPVIHIPVKPPVVSNALIAEMDEDQAIYSPGSKVGKSTSYIPSVLWRPSQESIKTFEDKYGNVDDFVMFNLEWTWEHLEKSLTAEQIDAVALAIASLKEDKPIDRSFLEGDVTGFGKGRILMAVARYCVLNGLRVVFFTKDDNLFSNLWGDARDIGTEDILGQPFIFKAGAHIYDLRSPDLPIIHKSQTPKFRKQFENGDHGDYMVGFCTYDQINTLNNVRVQSIQSFLSERRGVLILDESQSINNYSASTSKNMIEIKKDVYGCINASATSSRNIKNMSAYDGVYPWLKKLENTFEYLGRDTKRWLAEYSVIEAVKNGKMIRREHDMSGIDLQVDVLKNQDALKLPVDAFADVWEKVVILSRKVNEWIDDRNEEIINNIEEGEEPPLYYNTPLQSYVSMMSNQFICCLMVDQMAESMIKSFEEGRKPFLVIDMTMEAVLNQLNGIKEDDDSSEMFEDTALKPMTFKDIMFMSLDKFLTVSRYRGREIDRRILSNEDIPELSMYIEQIEKSILTFPDVSISPIDAVRDKVEAEGLRRFDAGLIDKPWKIGEISGRTSIISNGEYKKVETLSKNEIMSKFNNGYYDGAISTRRGSTGMNGHHTQFCKDNRPRRMIIGMGIEDPGEEIQMRGRVNRRGQKSKPDYKLLDCGIPYHTINIAIREEKCAHLMSSVSGSGRKAFEGIPDYFSKRGNEIAKDILEGNRKLREKLGIFMNKDEREANNELYFVKALLKRSMLLKWDEQKRLFDLFNTRYCSVEMDGETRLVTGMSGRWIPVERRVIDSGDGSHDTFSGGEVFLTRIAKVEFRDTYSSQDVSGKINKNPVDSNEHIEFINRNMTKWLDGFRPSYIKSVEQALFFYGKANSYPAYRNNMVGKKKEEADKVLKFLHNIKCGSIMKLPDSLGDPSIAVVVDISIPDIDKSFRFHDYRIRYCVPGEAVVHNIGLDNIIKENSEVSFFPDRTLESVANLFDEQKPGETTIYRDVINGNMIRASLFASRISSGEDGNYIDTEGNKCYGIAISKKGMERIFKAKIMVPNIQQALFLLKRKNNCSIGHGNEQITVYYQNGDAIIRFPDNQKSKKMKSIKDQIDMDSKSNFLRLPDYEFEKEIAPVLFELEPPVFDSKVRDVLQSYIKETGNAYGRQRSLDL